MSENKRRQKPVIDDGNFGISGDYDPRVRDPLRTNEPVRSSRKKRPLPEVKPRTQSQKRVTADFSDDENDDANDDPNDLNESDLKVPALSSIRSAEKPFSTVLTSDGELKILSTICISMKATLSNTYMFPFTLKTLPFSKPNT